MQERSFLIHIEINFPCILGISSNNQAKKCAVLKGVTLSAKGQIQHLVIIVHSLNTIKILVKGTSPRDAQLSNVFKKIRYTLKDIPSSLIVMWTIIDLSTFSRKSGTLLRISSSSLIIMWTILDLSMHKTTCPLGNKKEILGLMGDHPTS
jgi:hypothetical protein